MTEEEILEIIAHPRVQAYVQRVADQAALRVLASAIGDLSYADAARYLGCPRDSVRTYVHRGSLERGAGRGKVTLASCIRFKRSYRPSGVVAG